MEPIRAASIESKRANKALTSIRSGAALSQRSLHVIAIWLYDVRKLSYAQGIGCKIMQATSCIVSVRLCRLSFTRIVFITNLS
jgi:hypothetical protein